MPLVQHIVRYCVLFLLVQLSGCSIYSLPQEQPAPMEKPRPPYTVKPGPVTGSSKELVPSTSTAHQPLMKKAAKAAAQGDYEQALALLERAQRIAPDNAEIYLSMAKTQWGRGDREQAGSMAERGLLYCVSMGQCNALRAYIP